MHTIIGNKIEGVSYRRQLVPVFIAQGISRSNPDVFHTYGGGRCAIGSPELPSADAIISSEEKQIAHRRQILGLEVGATKGEVFDESWNGHGVDGEALLRQGENVHRKRINLIHP
jgi:hypothetical protein